MGTQANQTKNITLNANTKKMITLADLWTNQTKTITLNANNKETGTLHQYYGQIGQK